MSSDGPVWKGYLYALMAPTILSLCVGPLAGLVAIDLYRPEWLGQSSSSNPKDLRALCIAVACGFLLDAFVLAIPTVSGKGGGEIRDRYGIVQERLTRFRYPVLFRVFTGAWAAGCLVVAAVFGIAVLRGDV
jgi:hypothetical protein